MVDKLIQEAREELVLEQSILDQPEQKADDDAESFVSTNELERNRIEQEELEQEEESDISLSDISDEPEPKLSEVEILEQKGWTVVIAEDGVPTLEKMLGRLDFNVLRRKAKQKNIISKNKNDIIKELVEQLTMGEMKELINGITNEELKSKRGKPPTNKSIRDWRKSKRKIVEESKIRETFNQRQERNKKIRDKRISEQEDRPKAKSGNEQRRRSRFDMR